LKLGGLRRVVISEILYLAQNAKIAGGRG